MLHLGRFTAGAGIIPVAAAAQCVLLLFRLQVRQPACLRANHPVLLHSHPMPSMLVSPRCPQFFSRVFRATRFAAVDDIQAVLHDVRGALSTVFVSHQFGINCVCLSNSPQPPCR